MIENKFVWQTFHSINDPRFHDFSNFEPSDLGLWKIDCRSRFHFVLSSSQYWESRSSLIFPDSWRRRGPNCHFFCRRDRKHRNVFLKPHIIFASNRRIVVYADKFWRDLLDYRRHGGAIDALGRRAPVKSSSCFHMYLKGKFYLFRTSMRWRLEFRSEFFHCDHSPESRTSF